MNYRESVAICHCLLNAWLATSKSWHSYQEEKEDALFPSPPTISNATIIEVGGGGVHVLVLDHIALTFQQGLGSMLLVMDVLVLPTSIQSAPTCCYSKTKVDLCAC